MAGSFREGRDLAPGKVHLKEPEVDIFSVP
jgi:hypothetical protein